jgi:dissimilatory sulfite reductase (desulfoviridin) alpha/beta subunit
VTSDTILSEIARLDRSIALPVNDINTRMVIGEACYGDVWQGVDLEVEFDAERCQGCRQCLVMKACPMKAVRFDSLGARALRDELLCFHCGLCVSGCPKGAFQCRMGAIRMKTASGKIRTIPVVLRQSDKMRALRMAEDLKRRIMDGSFRMTESVERIS